MKSIDTLVPDILGLFDDDRVPLSPESMAGFSEALAAKVAARLGETRRGDHHLRMSNLGSPCARKLWYKINTPEKAEPLSAEVRVKFLFGDILEEMLLFLAREAGHTVEREQEEVEIDGILGHIDAVIDGVLVDCKSASTLSYGKFEAGLEESADDFGYLGQLDLYLHATDLDRGAFLVIDKQLGRICLDGHTRSDRNIHHYVNVRREQIHSANPPKRAYRDVADGQSGNKKLGVQCSYCDFKNTCWPGLRTFLYANGPRFLTEVRRTPKVPEA